MIVTLMCTSGLDDCLNVRSPVGDELVFELRHNGSWNGDVCLSVDDEVTLLIILQTRAARRVADAYVEVLEPVDETVPPFAVGDWVECVSTFGSGKIIAGNVYQVVERYYDDEASGDYVYVTRSDDMPYPWEIGGYDKSNFKPYKHAFSDDEFDEAIGVNYAFDYYVAAVKDITG